MSSEIEYKGVIYPSIAELARVYGKSEDVLYNRLSLGWDIETAMETPIVNKTIKIIYNGKLYNSFYQLANELELPYKTLYSHYCKTKNIETAIEKTYKAMRKEPLTVWNKQYNSYQQIASAFGVESYKLIKHINQGYEIEDAIIYLLESDKICFNNKIYNSMIELVADYNIQPDNVKQRIYLGWTLKEALTTPIRVIPGLSTEYRNQNYFSQVELCRAYGISVACVREQLRTHDSLSFIDMFDVFVKMKEKCLIPYSEQINTIPRCVINGKIYNRLIDFSNETDLTPKAISVNIRNTESRDLIDALKLMQNKTVVRYLYDGQLVQCKDLKKFMDSRRIKKMAENKIYIPQFPTLMKYDFNDRSFDSTRIFYEFLNQAEMAVNENMNADIDEEDIEIEEGPSMSM